VVAVVQAWAPAWFLGLAEEHASLVVVALAEQVMQWVWTCGKWVGVGSFCKRMRK
jgi:hypothetical protein